MCIFRITSAVLLSVFATSGAALAVETKAQNNTTTRAVQATKLETTLLVSKHTRPMTTQDDIAKQLLGPNLISPIAENLAK